MNFARQPLEAFLANQSALPPKTNCSRCKAVLVLMEGTFFFLGSQKSWTVPMPVCPNCDLKDVKTTERQIPPLAA
jgi:hypothetical protein